MNVKITPAADAELDIPVNDVDALSFIDNNTHGKGATFGLTESNKGSRVLIINSANVVTVEVEL